MSEHRHVLRSRFALLATASVCSGLGNGFVAAAFPLLAASLTTSPIAVVGVTVAAYLPWPLFGLLGGVVGDRYTPRRTVAWVESARAIVLLGFAVLVATGRQSIALVYVVVFLVTAGDTVFTGVVNSLVPRLVAPERLAHANGRLLTAQTSSENAIGPAIGGALFVLLAAAPFALDGASFILSGVLTGLAARSLGAGRTERATSTFRADLHEGVRSVRGSPILRRLLLVVTGFAAAQAMMTGPLVLYTTRTLHMSPTGFGLLLGISSLGNVAGGIFAGRLVERMGAVPILARAGALIAAAYLVAGLAPNALVATAALTIEAVGVAVGVVGHITVRQRLVDPALLGRVGNLFRTATMGIMPIGALIGGILAASLGFRSPLLAAAATQTLVVLCVLPGLGRLATLEVATS